ncbi:glycerol-3-phosphate dehydrogenase subunit GlpB [Pasteurellaceae bacterium HPA106]|uniref:glycerol-3-phosphate dehydrogenase subunit GlpB n=1 Tax=Spirabiliibacterium pneumoniae TaxID=221400 RepID=UPI001AADACF4|nr:glycerol-3-phosphate dehydrogenase subunit GlpB [Spirabiliibacterium pneumoniae]MBE2896830.1 glycerol-3-phosphate dehydrogenase subunit GlpB [Spirabiliibacterium pneumoniae]
MKFDNVIIGGGLAGLICGIRLQQAGQRCAIISTGQSALDFSSGSFDFLNQLPNGDLVFDFAQGVRALSEQHPTHLYSVIGESAVMRARSQFLAMKEALDLNLHGQAEQNHLRLTPLGALRPTWLTPRSVPTFSQNNEPLEKKRVVALGIEGFNDFQPHLLCDNMQRLAPFSRWDIHHAYLHIPELDHLRRDAREFRSINISQALEHKLNFDQLVHEIKKAANGADHVFLPACFGLDNDHFLYQLAQACGLNLHELPTLPPSLLGIRQNRTLQAHFERLGGILMKGDKVLRAEFEQSAVSGLKTQLSDGLLIKSTRYVLASGSFFSNGLIAHFDQIIEPVFGLDLEKSDQRTDWTHHRFSAPQPYQQYGVKINAHCQAFKQSAVCNNIYAIGAVVAGSDAIHLGCGSGVAVVSALNAAEHILQEG